MKSVILVLALTCAVSLAADDDQKCKNDFQSFLKCVKDKYDQMPQADKDQAKKDRQDKATKCFTDNGCDAPDWNANPLGGRNRPGGLGGQKKDMPEAVKQCLKKRLIEKIGTKLNGCLDKKGVKNVNFSQIADAAEGSGIGMDEHGSSGVKDGIHASMMAKFNAVKAVDKCAQKKGGPDTVKPLEQCLQKIKHDEKPKVCAFIKPCEDKVSGDCKQRGQQIRTALCECKKEKEAEVATKLRDLGQKNQKVGIQDLLNTIAEDQDIQDMMKQVDQCYKDAGEDEPEMLKIAMKFMANGSSGGNAKLAAMMSINGSTCIVMADMMQLDADDKDECKPCA